MNEPADPAKRGLIVRIRTAASSISPSKLLIAGFIVGVFSWLHYLESAATQPVTVNAGSDDLRAVYANAADVAEGRSLAEASCSGCHGANGISDTAGIPNLAGQRAAYLHLELRVYQTGGRGNNDMSKAVKFLSDEALFKVAAYYTSLDPAPEGTAKTAQAHPPEPDPVQAGTTAAAVCAGCHGETGISKTPGTPSLAGLDPKYLIAAMSGYKSGHRKHDLMKALLGNIGDTDLANIALYYALQRPERAQAPVSGDQTAGKAASAACAGCHGEQGVSGNPSTPSLAGQDAQYVASAIKAYKDGSRDDTTMKGLVASLDADTIQNLAAFYSAQQPQAPSVHKPLTTTEWAQRCDRCHGVNGNSTDPRAPALAGQRADYLKKVLDDYRSGARRSPQMAAMSTVLSDQDVDKLAAYYAGQKARAFVYVIVSPNSGTK
jgi:cytochrome c553